MTKGGDPSPPSCRQRHPKTRKYAVNLSDRVPIRTPVLRHTKTHLSSLMLRKRQHNISLICTPTHCFPVALFGRSLHCGMKAICHRLHAFVRRQQEIAPIPDGVFFV